MIFPRVIAKLFKDGTLRAGDRVLVVCGGKRDRDVLFENGFRNVTITNVDTEVRSELAPFIWEHQDVENLTYPDRAFDVVMVNDGLHHCYSPHRGLLEMYRTAARVVVVFENRDSLALNVAKRLGLTDDYEIEAVTFSGYESGGVGNSRIPNYIYRWMERDVEKTIRSYAPQYQPHLRFFYGLELPMARLRGSNQSLARLALLFLAPALKLLSIALPKQGNEFGFVIEKKERLQPWLTETDGIIAVDRKVTQDMGRAPPV